MADDLSVVTAVSEQRSPESSVLDHAQRIGHARSGRFAVRLHLSRLRQHNRQPHHIRIASRTFDSLLNAHDAQLYVMGSGDIILMCKDIQIDTVDSVFDKIRILFRNDPLVVASRSPGRGEFVSWFDFDIDYDLFIETLQDMVDASNRAPAQTEDPSAGRGQGAPFAGQMLDSLSAAKLEDSINRLQILDVINQQPAVIIGGDGTERILFQETFVSITALQQKLAPGYNIVSDTWLFQHLTEALDRRMLAALERRNFSALKDNISINLNVKTVLGKEFERFDDAIAEHSGKVVIELQQIDVFANIRDFKYARNWLRDRGYRVLLDGLNPLCLQYFDPGLLDADYYKVAWGIEFTETESADEHEKASRLVAKIGHDRFILARTESEDAMRWGLSTGIRRFQGYFIDQLISRQLDRQGSLAARTASRKAK